MLTKIKFKNFKSFKQETVIDVSTTNYKMLSDTNVNEGVLKGLLFVGSNGSGKTNAILSIKLLLELLFVNESINLNEYFCFFCKDEKMMLEYTFKLDNEIIVYGFEYSKKNGVPTVLTEYLKQNNEEIFKRIGTNAESKITEKTIYDSEDISPENLFIKNIWFMTKFVGVPTLSKLFNFLNNSVYVNSVEKRARSYNSNMSTLIYKYLEKNGVKEINDFFEHFGFNQKIVYQNKQLLSDGISVDFGNNKEIFLKRNNIELWFPLVLESLGNQTLLNILPSILHAVQNDCILIIDEFSCAFHNELEELIVRYFMNKAKKSQLFFVSHSTNLLSTTLLRPDQIYSTEFIDENGTVVKRFSSEGPRESQNLEKMYLSGIFNGIPNYEIK